MCVRARAKLVNYRGTNRTNWGQKPRAAVYQRKPTPGDIKTLILFRSLARLTGRNVTSKPRGSRAGPAGGAAPGLGHGGRGGGGQPGPCRRCPRGRRVPGPSGSLPAPGAIAPGQVMMVAGLQTLCFHTLVLGRRKRGFLQTNLCREIKIKMQQAKNQTKIKIVVKRNPRASPGGASPIVVCSKKQSGEKNAGFV